MLPTFVIALIVGFLFGIVLQRSFFCMYQGTVNAMLQKDFRVFKGVILAVIVATIGFYALSTFGVITLSPAPFFWGADILGGIIFGVGMVLAGSCMGGMPMRAGQGMLGYWLTVLGVGVGGWMIIFGWLKPLREQLWEATKVTVNGGAPTVPDLLGVNPWIIVVIFVAILGFVWWKLNTIEKEKGVSAAQAQAQQKEQPQEEVQVEQREQFEEEVQAEQREQPEEKDSKVKKGAATALWSAVAIGIGFGVIELISFAWGGQAIGWETVPGTSSILKGIVGQGFGWGKMSWPIMVVAGVLIGVFVSAVVAKDLKIRKTTSWKQALSLFVGGFLIAVGAVTASGGCNMAHTFAFLPQLSVSSFVVLFFMFMTAGLIVRFRFGKYMQQGKSE